MANDERAEESKESSLDKKDDRAKAFTPVGTTDGDPEDLQDEILSQINDELAKQVKTELGEPVQEENEEPKIEQKKKRKFPIWARIISGILGVIACLAIVFLGTPWGRAQTKKLAIYLATEYAYSKMDYDDGKNVVAQDPTEDVASTTTSQQQSLDIMWGNSGYDGSGRHEDDVINVLLLGEEAIGSGTARGRTDLMMIATMNVKDKSVKLTSLMRDMLVQIPDHDGRSYLDNKLNTAYEVGGVQFLYETIAKNFDIALDGYALVNFENFEKVIDALGGVEVTLSEQEARYLNSTNYISNKAYRNVKAGTQKLNGNQALGFCRVRHVPTIDDQHYDYGRTSRQRVVLNAIFDQCKSLGPTQLVMLMNNVLQYVTTDINKEQFRNYMEIGLSLNLSKIDNCRIPADGTYKEGSERGMSVLIPDLDANIKVLHHFIFGDPLEEGLSDGEILDGMKHIDAIQEKKSAQSQQNSTGTTTGTTGTN